MPLVSAELGHEVADDLVAVASKFIVHFANHARA
jgi:hypothetical protein